MAYDRSSGGQSMRGIARDVVRIPASARIAYSPEAFVWDDREAQEGDSRPHFLMLARLTARGRKAVGDFPRRILEVNHEVEQHGCEVVAQYALLGGYDFATIIAANDNAAVHQCVTDLASRGILETVTVPAIPTDRYITFLKAPVTRETQ